MILKKPHNDRSGNIIRQVCHYFQRLLAVLLRRQLSDIHFQHVFVNNLYIVVTVQRILQNRDQRPVDLDRHNFPGGTGEILRHRSYPRSYLEHAVVLPDLCRADDLIKHMCVDQKILTKFFLKHKIIFLEHRNCILRITKGWFFHIALHSRRLAVDGTSFL